MKQKKKTAQNAKRTKGIQKLIQTTIAVFVITCKITQQPSDTQHTSEVNSTVNERRVCK